jgi:hypothetical protein
LGFSGSTRSPRADRPIRIARRFCLVSSFFALMIQCVANRRYPGGCALKNAAAPRFARSSFSTAGSSTSFFARSNEYRRVRSGSRRSNARRPAGAIRRSFCSSRNRFVLTALQ